MLWVRLANTCCCHDQKVSIAQKGKIPLELMYLPGLNMHYPVPGTMDISWFLGCSAAQRWAKLYQMIVRANIISLSWFLAAFLSWLVWDTISMFRLPKIICRSGKSGVDSPPYPACRNVSTALDRSSRPGLSRSVAAAPLAQSCSFALALFTQPPNHPAVFLLPGLFLFLFTNIGAEPDSSFLDPNPLDLNSTWKLNRSYKHWWMRQNTRVVVPTFGVCFCSRTLLLNPFLLNTQFNML